MRRSYLAGTVLVLVVLAVLLLMVRCRHTPPPKPQNEIARILAGISIDYYRDPNLARQYERRAWKHWVDADQDCQNTREEVLIRDAKTITFSDVRGCRIQSGVWRDPYSGREFTSPSDLDVDHVVPLKDAFVSGGYAWNAEEKERFANDLREPHYLRAVFSAENRTKSDHSPDEWMPSSTAHHCQYLRDWVRIKAAWRLSMTKPEHQFIGERLTHCQ